MLASERQTLAAIRILEANRESGMVSNFTPLVQYWNRSRLPEKPAFQAHGARFEYLPTPFYFARPENCQSAFQTIENPPNRHHAHALPGQTQDFRKLCQSSPEPSARPQHHPFENTAHFQGGGGSSRAVACLSSGTSQSHLTAPITYQSEKESTDDVEGRSNF